MIEIVVPLIAAALGALGSVVKDILKQWANHSPSTFASETGQVVLKVFGVKPKQVNETANLLSELSKTSAQMDTIIAEIGKLTEERQSKMLKLENDVTLLSQREQEIKARIEGLEKVPLPAAEYFAKLVEKTEKKSQIRDYVLFLSGVIVTAVVAVVLKKLGWG
jgi:vacuolar-type H+-ATPase subunit D/Vma8